MNSPAIDIYTLKEIGICSSEHILLNALGGRLQTTGIIDKSTNDIFGQTIDSELLKLIEPFRVILNTRKGDGGNPPSLRGVTSEDGRRLEILPGGVPRLANPSMKTEVVGGSRVLTASFRSMEEARQHISAWAAKHAPDMDINDALAQAVEVSEQPNCNFQLKLSSGGLRCIAKMACNLFVLANQSFFLGSDFDLIRKFVREGAVDQVSADTLVHGVASAIRLDWSRTGASSLDHFIGYDVVDDQVIGSVILFGHLQFRIQIGRSSVRPEKNRATYRVNPFLGLDRLNQDMSILDDMSAAGSALNANEAVVAGVQSFLEFLKEPLRFLDAEHILARHAQVGRPCDDEVVKNIISDCYSEFSDFLKAHGFVGSPTS